MIGSPTHIRQIMINLLDNSIKYNKHGGSVTFSSNTKPLDNGRALFCFSVSDTGIGMTPKFLKHIYEPFAQEGDDARSKFQGTGMGMPIVKSLIELMDGTIEISSEVGVGSTFNVQIPLDIDKDPQARERADEQADSCSLAGMNVLLAEDNELNAEIAQALLESEGIVVTRAAGMNAHLSKPLDFNKLKNILARIKKNGAVSL